MTGLAIGCVLSGLDAPLLMAPAAVLSAVLDPGVSRLYAGQALADMPVYDTMVAPGNFTSTAGAITGVAVTFTGDAVSATAPLTEGEAAGFTVVATDSEGNERAFPAGTTTVEYKVRVTLAAGNEAAVEINDLVPDGEAISIVIDGGAHAGTYDTLTAGDLRNGPAHFPGTISISHPGAAADLTVDDVLTALPGLWATSTGNLTFSYQWQADGVDISGATSSTFAITADEQGTDITVEVTGDDGANATVMAESAAVSVPAAASTFAVERAIATYIGSPATTSTPSFTLDLSAYPAGTMILAFYGNEYLVISGTMQGNAMTIEQVSGTTSGARASALSYVLTSDGSATETITFDVGTALGFHALDVWAITGGAVVSTATQTRADATPFSISVTPDNADNVILAFVAGRQDASTAFTWDTLTEVDDERVAAGNNSYMTTAYAEDLTSGVPYPVTGSLAGSTFRHSMIALAITPV